MKAQKLYNQLEKDFIKPELSDDWSNHMNEVKEFLSDNFIRRSMGVVCDFTDVVNKVYTAVFPTDEVMQAILDKREKNIMLFVHHPSIWDITKAPDVFYQMNKQLLKKFKENKISIYNLHVPLDNFGEYSTSGTLAKALGVKIEKPFAPYFGALAGVFGKINCNDIRELKKIFKNAVGHDVKLYNYGENKIKNKAWLLLPEEDLMKL